MDLISKEDAVALITAEMDKIRTHNLVDGTARINLRLAKNIIEDMPTIDIVRCKECKYWIENLTDDDADETYGECCFDWDIKMPKADDFCSYGEREGE